MNWSSALAALTRVKVHFRHVCHKLNYFAFVEVQQIRFFGDVVGQSTDKLLALNGEYLVKAELFLLDISSLIRSEKKFINKSFYLVCF